MRPAFVGHYCNKYLHQTIHFYLILSYALQVFGVVFATSATNQHDFAKKLLEAGKYSDALSHFQHAINNNPNNYLTYFNRASVFITLNKPNLALDDLNKALELNVDFTSALIQRASLHVKMGNLDQAYTDYNKLLKQEPNNKDALIMHSKIEKLIKEKANITQDIIAEVEKRFEIHPNATSNVSQQFIHQVNPKVNDSYSTVKRPRSKNYASAECAKVVETNPEAKKASHIINDMIDEYMLNPCKAKIWFVIELCETIQATHIEIANHELFSSTLKDFTVYFSDIYPAMDWKLVGQFTASDMRALQTFDLNQVGFGKFIRVELHTHYGTEHYCPISEVKVYGASMVDEYEKENLVEINVEQPARTIRKPKTSAYRVYRNMMTFATNACGLTPTIVRPNKSDKRSSNLQQKEKPSKIVQPQQPTQQPVVKPNTPLKPSIFVELSNKVKALETSLKLQREEMEKRLNETEVKFEKFMHEFKSSVYNLIALVLAYLVYNMFLELM